jgi:hypothetical protein
MYERVAFPPAASFLGQLQDDSKPQYTVDANADAKAIFQKDWDTNYHVEIALETDDLKGAWRSILACGKSVERQLNGELPGEKKPLLSTLLSFVGNAYRLPPPESIFGTHHVMVEEVCNNLIFILEHIQGAQEVQAKITDKVFNEAHEGIDSDGLLKFLDNVYETLPIKLPDVESLYSSRVIVVEWEARALLLLDLKDEDLGEPRLWSSLENAETLHDEAKSHGYVSKVFVQLVQKIRKAYDLRGRILQWKDTFINGGKGSLKTLSALMKEVNRIRLGFAEAKEVLEFHQMAESWIDRANVAIRSKISLHEINMLITAAEENVPLDLSEWLEKLKTRVRSANLWLEALENVVPFKHLCHNTIEWMGNLQSSLHNGDQVRLHELSSEGNRIPVDVDEAKILQVSLDARNWSAKALKWLPSTPDSKKGKLCDLKEHLEILSSLRKRLPLSDPDRAIWSPEGAKELSDIVDATDAWFEKVI